MFQPKTSSSLSLSGMQRKLFIYCRNRTNLQQIALIYFSIRLIRSYVRFMLGNSTIRYICDIQHLNIIYIIPYFDKIVIVGRVMRGGSTWIEKGSTSPRGYISVLMKFLEGARIKAWGYQLEWGRLVLYSI